MSSSVIDDKFAPPDLPDFAREKCTRILDLYGDNCVKWTWSPNASDNNPLDAPSGFACEVKSSSSLIFDVFHPEKLNYGTAAYRLDDASFVDGEKLNLDRLIKSREEYKEILNESIKERTSNPARLGYLDTKRFKDSEPWEAQLGSGGAYAGIFYSNERGDYDYKTHYWIVVQSGCPQASADLFTEMEESKDGNWEDFFLKNPQSRYLSQCSKRNRQRLLYDVAKSLDLNIKGESDLMSVNRVKMLKPTIETISHLVTMNSSKNVVYHSNTTNAGDNRGGTILNESPFVGPLILKGPPGPDNEYGLSWKSTQEVFPTCTGRNKIVELLPSNSLDIEVEEKWRPFVWEGEKGNSRLSGNVYRKRDIEFKKSETELGYKHIWGEIQLIPVIVKVASTF